MKRGYKKAINGFEKEVKKDAHRLPYILGFILFFYLFIVSLTIIKVFSFELGRELFSFNSDSIGALNAVGLGWLFTLILQSSAAASSSFAAMAQAGLLGAGLLVFLTIGTRIGSSITGMIVTFVTHSKKRRDFRHGFEIALLNLVYIIPIAILVFILEYFFKLISSSAQIISLSIPLKEISLINIITSPFISILSGVSPIISIIAGLVLLGIAIEFMPKTLLGSFGKNKTKSIIHRFLGKKYGSFLTGLLITLILFSTNITITLLIPFVVKRLVNLKKIIPYVIGANLGGLIDVFLASVIIGSGSIPMLLAHVSISLVGLLWLCYTEQLFRITKFISKRIVHISKKKAILFMLAFIVLAIILASV